MNEYERINKDLTEYLTIVLDQHPDIPVLDFIEDYAFKHDIDFELIGDVIRDNPVISNLVRIEVFNAPVIEEW